MNFDDLLEAWRAQDEAQLYGVNQNLLQLVLQNEQARIRRLLRRDLWVASLSGISMVSLAGVWLVVLLYTRAPMLQAAVATVATLMFMVWIGAFWLSQRRQAQRERDFGATLQEEIRRSLSLVEYQLSNGGRRDSALRWVAPPLIGALLIHWLVADINDIPWSWSYGGIPILLMGWMMWMAYTVSQQAERKLETRRQRLSALVEILNSGE